MYRRPLLQVETGRLILLDRRQKHKWNVTICSWKAKLCTLHTEKILACEIFSFVHDAEGDRATSSSFASRNGSIDASRLSLEMQMEHDFIQLEGEVGHFAHGKKVTCLQFLPLFMAQWVIGQRHFLLQVETVLFMLPDCL